MRNRIAKHSIGFIYYTQTLNVCQGFFIPCLSCDPLSDLDIMRLYIGKIPHPLLPVINFPGFLSFFQQADISSF